MYHDGLTPESTIWSCDTGQWTPCFQSCHSQHGCEKYNFIKLQAPTLARKWEI